ncbi:MAG TPA: UDP-4-amino-4,6-dideoxy-N-acetyl-beta-L-altrosamine transaminase [Thermoplasmata archaeon]|nr:UDP-4-amino-4,6-dideoxy-N-acetyl-beta-L-altrosamine transaminase [Thermoplasmata archaeon]
MSRPEKLAVDGGSPVRETLLPYGHQSIDDEDVEEVVAALRSDWLTTGPLVERFESEFARKVGAKHAVACSNGTAALHLAYAAAGLKAGDEALVPPITFAADANMLLLLGAKPRFVDVDRGSMLIDSLAAAKAAGRRTKALVAVDYTGQPCDYDEMRKVCEKKRLVLIADACHALGGSWNGRPVGTLADLNVFSFHPVKHVTTGEGGMITTDDDAKAARMRVLRNHGITTDFRKREERGTWKYEVAELGHNYRLTDMQCALGLSQLRKLDDSVKRRREIAKRYDREFAGGGAVEPLEVKPGAEHAYHLYVVKLAEGRWKRSRDEVYRALRAEGIGVNVHYAPIHLHPLYRRMLKTKEGMCPVAEREGERILTLPLYPGMSDGDVGEVVEAVDKVNAVYGKT